MGCVAPLEACKPQHAADWIARQSSMHGWPKLGLPCRCGRGPSSMIWPSLSPLTWPSRTKNCAGCLWSAARNCMRSAFPPHCFALHLCPLTLPFNTPLQLCPSPLAYNTVLQIVLRLCHSTLVFPSAISLCPSTLGSALNSARPESETRCSVWKSSSSDAPGHEQRCKQQKTAKVPPISH